MATHQVPLKIFFTLITMIPGPGFYSIYKMVTENKYFTAISLFSQKDNLSIIFATFSFTMLGFLAAIITVIFGLIHSKSFVRYEKKGRLSVFLYIYILSIINLLITFMLSILSFSNNCLPIIFNATCMSAINNIAQILLITIIIINLFKNAAQEQ